VCLLSFLAARQLYRTQGVRPSAHPLAAAVLHETKKDTLCFTFPTATKDSATQEKFLD
jgi:hypothetical protein